MAEYLLSFTDFRILFFFIIKEKISKNVLRNNYKVNLEIQNEKISITKN